MPIVFEGATISGGISIEPYVVPVSKKAIFGYGAAPPYAITNLVSNTGVVASNTTGVGTARYYLAAASYG